MKLSTFSDETKISLFKRYGYKKAIVWQDAKQPRYGFEKIKCSPSRVKWGVTYLL